MELMKYLIDAIPKSLEASKDGWTPLLLAFSLNRSNAANILIGNGADQLKRDKLGRNIMHLAFAGANGDIQCEAVEVKSMLELIDKRFVPKLSVGRCTEGPGALTHLARWSYRMQRCFNKGASPKCDVLEVLLEVSNGTDLEIMDGSGHLSLHVAMKASAVETNVIRTWRVCEETAKKYPGKRKLVSLNDANEVSKRLAKKKSKQSDVKDKNQNGEEKASDLKDEVSEWYHHAGLLGNIRVEEVG
ncbi:MAG: hypothetical protein M1830_005284 [Pleopsidium flavum]|nr:MAG: hypothetical protein M1830_005284 [Pleopsidium flavum]